MNETVPAPKVVNIINFHGLTLWVISYEDIEYICAKPLADLAGIDWRSAKKTLFDEDNAVLYGSKWLKHPVFASQGGASTPRDEGLYVRLDRSRMYLARIKTNQMKAQGKVEAAEALLNLQIEWAEALHDYETQGIAVKSSKIEARRKEEISLTSLLKHRKEAVKHGEQEALSAMINDKLADLGYPPDAFKDPQGRLEGV